LQDCQVRFRVTVLQEFLHTDRREGCHDGGISPLIRAAPRKPDAIDAMAPVLTAPEPNATLLGVLLCLPTAPALPIGESGDFGTSPFFWAALGQAAPCQQVYMCGAVIKAQWCVENLIRN